MEFESPFIYLFAMVWGGGQEDLGWRDFMLPILQDSYSVLVSSAIVFVCVRSPSDWSLTRREWALLIGGYLLLAVACYREAVAIAQIAG